MNPELAFAVAADRISPDLAEETVALIAEMAAEIWNLTDKRNPLLAKAREMRKRIEEAVDDRR